MNNEAIDINALLSASARKVEAKLRGLYPSKADADTLENAELYSLMAGGKRIRPFLVLELCRLFGGTEEAAMPFACALEMLHTFSLIHDDLPCMDNDDLRRGIPTNHRVFGEATALLAGDALEIRAISVAAHNSHIEARHALRAVKALSDGAVEMISGQIMDMSAEKNALSFDELVILQAKKTGALMELGARLGCIAAKVEDDDERMRDAVHFARDVGRAFQIIDDVLDAESTAQELGKNVGSDERDGKVTYLSFMSAAEARLCATETTAHAVDAIKKYRGSETLVRLAEWLIGRRK